MTSATLLVLAMMMQAGVSAGQPEASPRVELRRGTSTVGARTSDAPAIRAEEVDHPASPAFMLGASLQAWRNAAGAVAYDSTHVTGDGGDAALLAEACSDERIGFGRLELRRTATGASEAQIVSDAGFSPAMLASWLARRSNPPAACR